MRINTIIAIRQDWHVVPCGSLWELKRELRHERYGLYTTQAEAMGEGMTQARLGAVSLIVHGRNGRVRTVYSYDNVVVPD